MAQIHPMACVDPGAELDDDVVVGPFSYIADRVRIGAGSRLGPHVTVLSQTTLGQRCRVHAGAVLGDLPQDLSYDGAESFVDIGDDCVIREGVTIHRGSKEGTRTQVGDGCYLMANSHLAHNVVLGPRVILANGVLLAGHVRVGERAFLSGNAMVHQFARVGRLAILGGGSGATKDVPPFMILHGAELNHVVGINVIGMRRAGIDSRTRLDIKAAFRVLYRSGLNTAQAVARLRETYSEGPAVEICEFVESSKRGICGPVRDRGGEADASD